MIPFGSEVLAIIPTISGDTPNAPDLIGGNDGTLAGGVSYVRQRDDFGAVGHWDFDGSGSITSLDTTETGDYSVAIWFQKGLDGEQLWASVATPAQGIFVFSDTVIRVNFGTVTDFTVPAIGLGWRHLTVTREGTSLRVYLNGAESSTGALTDTNNMVLGNIGAGSFTGNIDDARLFKRQLKPSEVKELASRHAYQRRVRDVA